MNSGEHKPRKLSRGISEDNVRKITIFDKKETLQTVRLRINGKIYDKLIWLLSKFSRDEVEIIPESEDFIRNQKYLAGELNEIVSGKANYMELNEAETRLENVIKKHENSV